MSWSPSTWCNPRGFKLPSALVNIIYIVAHSSCRMSRPDKMAARSPASERRYDALTLRSATLQLALFASVGTLAGTPALPEIVVTMAALRLRVLMFGWKAAIALLANASVATVLRTHLSVIAVSDESKYMLVAGAVANAPNPAGVALLKRGFEDESDVRPSRVSTSAMGRLVEFAPDGSGR